VTSSLSPSFFASFDLEDLSILSRPATMKSFASLLAGSTALLSFISSAQAAFNVTDGPSCSAPKPDDSYFSVVGVQGTGVHPRQELRDLQQDKELWNLFILAFYRFQAMDQDEKISYFQIAGKKSHDYSSTFY
jgi:tyrosinase